MQEQTLVADEVEFHPHSYADPDGRLFRWSGGLYRALRGESAAFYGALLDDGVLSDLSREGLVVETDRTLLSLEGYDLVVRHRQIPFPSYPTEWCTAMFADAAGAYLDLIEALRQRGFALKDAHPWNLVFDATRPLFVDLTSIVPADACSPTALDQKYRRYYLLPLRLMTHGHGALARNLLEEYDGIRPADADLLSGERFARVRRALRRRRRPPHLDQLARSLRRELEPLRERAAAANRSEEGQDSDDRSGLAAGIRSLVDELRPQSVLLVDPPAWLPDAAAEHARVVVLDADERSSSARYARARERGASILSLLMDFRRPTPSAGYSSHSSIAATDRLACDLVVAADVVPRLAAHPFLTFDHISEGLSLFSGRWAVLGYGPPRLADPARQPPPWYGDIDLERALRRCFRSVDRMSSDDAVLFVCEK
jgi:hypothetical protein